MLIRAANEKCREELAPHTVIFYHLSFGPNEQKPGSGGVEHVGAGGQDSNGLPLLLPHVRARQRASSTDRRLRRSFREGQERRALRPFRHAWVGKQKPRFVHWMFRCGLAALTKGTAKMCVLSDMRGRVHEKAYFQFECFIFTTDIEAGPLKERT